MIDVTLDMEQYDCPFIHATEEHDLAFSAVHWEFDTASDTLETRMVVEGDDREALGQGLSELREHEGLREYRLLSKTGGVAHVRTVIDETAAMSTIRDGGGYITGPFYIADGSSCGTSASTTAARPTARCRGSTATTSTRCSSATNPTCRSCRGSSRTRARR